MGRPLGRFSRALLFALLAGPRRARELAALLDAPSSRYVSSYLNYWRGRGLVSRRGGLWELTPRGREYAASLLEEAAAAMARARPPLYLGALRAEAEGYA